MAAYSAKPVTSPNDLAADEIAASFGLSIADRIVSSPLENNRHVYRKSGRIYKLSALDSIGCGSFKARSLSEEARLLSRLDASEFTPKGISYHERFGFGCLTYDFIDGKPLQEARATPLILWRLLLALIKLSAFGIAHRDILARNVIVREDRGVVIIDFDQAIETTRLRALLMNIFGMSGSNLQTYGSFFDLAFPRTSFMFRQVRMMLVKLIKAVARRVLPASILNNIRSYRTWKRGSPPKLPVSASAKLVLLSEAWTLGQISDASSPSVPICYYELVEEGVRFPGERSWRERWDYLGTCTDYRDKAILELGANLGILSCFLLKDAGAKLAVTVDADARILAGAHLVAAAYDVSPISVRVDFDRTPNWEDTLSSFACDIVFCLNVVNWVQDKHRLLRFLQTANELIYEGHEPSEIEYARLRALGFAKITVVAKSERQREVYLCQR